MTLAQRPLLQPGPGELPSPLFTPQPGWGGRFREWLRENAYLAVFRLVLFVAIVVLVMSIFRNRPPASPDGSPSPSPAMAVEGHRPVAARGDGASQLAKRALSEHLAEYPVAAPLTDAEQAFAVDMLWRGAVAAAARVPFVLHVGDSLFFPHATIEAAVTAAKAMTPAERATWSSYPAR
jgi:hypothetical protein